MILTLGEVFELNSKKYIVEEGVCKKCSFYTEDCINLRVGDKIPECSSKFRADGKNFIFAKFKEDIQKKLF